MGVKSKNSLNFMVIMSEKFIRVENLTFWNLIFLIKFFFLKRFSKIIFVINSIKIQFPNSVHSINRESLRAMLTHFPNLSLNKLTLKHNILWECLLASIKELIKVIIIQHHFRLSNETWANFLWTCKIA